MRKNTATILEKNGKKHFVVLPYEQYVAFCERLAEAEDVLAMRQARREDAPSVPGLSIAELKRKLALSRTRPRRIRAARPRQIKR